jgi:hypothetical protein
MVPGARTPALKAGPRSDDPMTMRRALLLTLLLPILAAPPAQAQDVVGGEVVAGLNEVAEWHRVPPVTGALPAPEAPVRTAEVRRLLVAQLGLTDVADAVQAEAARAGLQPPARFGSEVVAGLLGLRRNQRDERRELQPWDPATTDEAEFAFAAARRANPVAVRIVLSTFRLPAYTPEQRFVLRATAQRIGMPYVWGGELDRPGVLGERQPVGGYDCSGLVWRVFKLSGLPAGRRIRGRTAAQQAGEVPRSTRIARSGVRPGDLLFFGAGRIWQRATERRITHQGIALSDRWMLHSSSAQGGVSALPIDARRFSWARRVL